MQRWRVFVVAHERCCWNIENRVDDVHANCCDISIKLNLGNNCTHEIESVEGSKWQTVCVCVCEKFVHWKRCYELNMNEQTRCVVLVWGGDG